MLAMLVTDSCDVTRTDAPRESNGPEPGVLGVLFVTPEERFYPLVDQAQIGRVPAADWALPGRGVSRRHARIERHGPVWTIRDLDSKNGTHVMGERRTLSPLSNQDTLRLGCWVGVVCRMPHEAIDRGKFFSSLMPGVELSAPTLAELPELPPLARANVPVVVYGETGTGKELMARAVHEHSGRAGRLVAINCAAIPESVAESELFGHRKGAFTGADAASEGHLAAARDGTLFLDEVVDLPLAVQAKLLRALEEKAVTPLGTSRPIATEFKLVAACQRPLEEAVRDGRFRPDLHARLRGAEIRLPPLRARRQEVLRLFQNALAAAGLPVTSSSPVDTRLDDRLIEQLCKHEWSQNVREVVQLARLLASRGQASYSVSDLPAHFLQTLAGGGAEAGEFLAGGARGGPSRRASWLSRHGKELEVLLRAIEQCRGNVSQAAEMTGIPRHRARRLLSARDAVCDRAKV